MLDRSDEVRGYGGPTIQATPELAGKLICWAAHPMAIAMGTIQPFVACSPYCTLYPQGHPTTWSFPA